MSSDAKLGEAFVRTRWPLLERLEQHRLVGLLLDLVRVLPGEERWVRVGCLKGVGGGRRGQLVALAAAASTCGSGVFVKFCGRGVCRVGAGVMPQQAESLCACGGRCWRGWSSTGWLDCCWTWCGFYQGKRGGCAEHFWRVVLVTVGGGACGCGCGAPTAKPRQCACGVEAFTVGCQQGQERAPIRAPSSMARIVTGEQYQSHQESRLGDFGAPSAQPNGIAVLWIPVLMTNAVMPFLRPRYFSDITLYGLEVLQLVTLSPLPRRAITAAGSSGSSSRGSQAGGARSGMATLLHAASTGNTQPFYGLADPEVCAEGGGCTGVPLQCIVACCICL